jgi:hypothetical protein
VRVFDIHLSVLVLALATSPTAVGQNSPADVVPSQAAIVWTGAQQPVPEPAPNTSAREIPPAQEGAQQNTERSPEQREQPGAQKPGQNPGEANSPASGDSENLRSVTGTVVREGPSYFLRTDDNSEYQLDDATKVRDFENQAVRITGTVDSSTRTIHVQTIKPNT